MDTNLDIYEPLKLAGSSVTSSVHIPSPETRSTDNLQLLELYPNYGGSEESDGTAEKQESVDDWNLGEIIEEEEIEEEEVESLVDWPSCASSKSSISESNKVGWATFKLADDPWADEKKPLFRVLGLDEIDQTEEEADGILSDRIVGACSSFLDRNPETLQYCAAKVQLKQKGIKDITILEAHRYLQYIDLSHNSLTDLYPLSGIPYLMYLDVSYNKLTSVLQFKAPWNLTYVNYAYNEVQVIDDLTDFWSLEYLDLSHNKITKIEGLQNLKYLTNLDLSFNNIERFENLSNLRVQNLNLQSNQISSFEDDVDIGMKTMHYLHYINISANKLSSLALFKKVYHVRIVQAQNNEIEDLMEADHLKTLHLLQELDLSNNPLTQWDKYREVIFHTVPSLCYLDGSAVTTNEKVSAHNLFAPSEILKAALDHSRLILLEDLNEPSLELDTLPVDQGPYPLVVLVGPPASCKQELISSLKNLFPMKIHVGVCHTSRAMYPDETDGLEYHFVTQEQFNSMTRNGMFLCVNEFRGASYGLSRMEVARAVMDKKLCITHMDLVSALTLNNRGIQPHLVLVITENEDRHLERLRQKYEAVVYDDMSDSSGAVSVHKPSQANSGSATFIAGNILESILWEKVYANRTSFDSPKALETERISKTEMGIEDPPSCPFRQLRKNVRLANVDASSSSACIGVANTSIKHGKKSLDKPTESSQADDEVSEVDIFEETFGIGNIFFNKDKENIKDLPVSKPKENRKDLPVPTPKENGKDLLVPTPKENGKDLLVSTPKDTGRPIQPVFSCSEILNSFCYENTPSLVNNHECLSVRSDSQVTKSRLPKSLPEALDSGNISFISTFECASIYSSSSVISASEDVSDSESSEEQTIDVHTLCEKENSSWEVSRDNEENIRTFYIRSILQSRDAYFRVHLEHPGVFSETVYSDDLDKAFHKLHKHIKKMFISHPAQRPIFRFEDDPAYKLMIPRRLEIFSQDIYRGHSAMEKQIDAAPKSEIFQPIKQRSTYRIVGDMENVVPKVHSRKCNLPY